MAEIFKNRFMCIKKVYFLTKSPKYVCKNIFIFTKTSKYVKHVKIFSWDNKDNKDIFIGRQGSNDIVLMLYVLKRGE